MQSSEPQQHPALPAAPVAELHVCPACASKFVQPLEWTEADESHWTVSLWCPNCLWSAEGTYPQDIMERFDIALDRGSEQLVAGYRRIVRANLAEEADRFAAALAVNALL